MNGIFANYLCTMFRGSIFWIFWIMWFFPRKYKYRCIRVYVWFKDDKHVIWMWIWLILTNITLLDRIWSLWLVRFAHSPPIFTFWLGRLIFSVSINSHPDNIYILSDWWVKAITQNIEWLTSKSNDLGSLQINTFYKKYNIFEISCILLSSRGHKSLFNTINNAYSIGLAHKSTKYCYFFLLPSFTFLF